MIDINRARPYQEVFFIVDDDNNIIGYENDQSHAEDALAELIYMGYILKGKIIYDERKGQK